MISGGVEVKVSRLESIVEQIGEAVLTTTETIESLAERLDHLSMQVEAQGKHLQQQSNQIFALCDALQNLAQSQDYTVQKLAQLTQTLDKLTSLIQGLDEEV
ncbi:hypothetical protein IQ259_14955 [Fortiea sp. LEGE XX443]|uniref:hypothetical protein n=1 Tax=Fortiea sp. LEGE XX443 TaxID=1828611 RepID=UPI0018815D00|nr:hypothetical protein [Fortiea sp. LEGE XX443]MBE9006321.1 hypothetical protein [Fortiea sp. LEGE XX443]